MHKKQERNYPIIVLLFCYDDILLIATMTIVGFKVPIWIGNITLYIGESLEVMSKVPYKQLKYTVPL